MGMFDTIRLDPPLKCPACGADIAEVQTHDFGDAMAVYRIGSVLTMSPVLTGIVKETLYCAACCKMNADASREWAPVYIGIWHSVLVAVGLALSEVERRLAAVDRLDLIAWLEQAQRQEQGWKRRFYQLHSDVRLYREHLLAPPEPAGTEDAARSAAFRRLWGLPDEVLDSPDPLGAILNRNEPDPKTESAGED